MTPIHTPWHQDLNQTNNTTNKASEWKKLSWRTKSKNLLQTGAVISAMLLAACHTDTSWSKAKETTTASQEETSQNLEEWDWVMSGSAAEKAYNTANTNTTPLSYDLNQSDFDQIESNVLDIIAFMKKKKKNTYKIKKIDNGIEFHYHKGEDWRESLSVVDNDNPKNGWIITIKNHKVDGVDEIGWREWNRQGEGRIPKVNALLRDFLDENNIQ